MQSSCGGWQKESACSRTGSNRRPLAHKTSALTTELQEPLSQQEIVIIYYIIFDQSF